ncbi:MAG TPA: CRTAC1 family protein, partial [Planctomycetota bacterium]|nr:CRTAC1 family protein [Planctomycetota bacterium]
MHPTPAARGRCASTCLIAAVLVAACGSKDAPEQADVQPAPQAAEAATIRRPPPELTRTSPPVVSGELRPLLAPRPPAMPPEVARALEHLDPARAGWTCVARVDAAERALRELLERRLAGGPGPADGEPPDAALLPEYPGRGVADAPRPQVEVEAVGYDEIGPGELEVECNVTLARRPAPASSARRAGAALRTRDGSWGELNLAFQLDYVLLTRWEDDGGRPRLVHAERRTAAAQAAVAESALFEERTRQAFGDDAAFDDEFLRGPDAYYFHSDRLSGFDLICNHGMAVGDLDGDGWEDLYVCMAPGLPNRLYLREPDGGVRDVAANLGVAYLDSTRSALILDLDGDGRRDLVCAVGSDLLVHWNEGATLSAPTVLRAPSGEDVFSMAAADYDGDGDLDIYACRYSSQGVMQGFPTPYHDARNGSPNLLWRNDGARTFEDVTAAVGLDEGNTRYSFAALWEDFDDDGDPDLYVANDFGSNHYWRNDGGRFTDVAREVGAEDMAAGMGLAVGDVDGDGDLDLYVSNMYAAAGLRSTSRAERFLAGRSADVLPLYRRHARGNTLLVNRGDGTWEDRSEASGAARAGWAWGALFLDVENDGDLDIYSPNGFASRRAPERADEYFWRHVIASSPVDGEITPQYHDAWSSMQYLYFELGHGWNGEEPNRLFLGDGRGSFHDASAISGADLPDDARSLIVLDWDRDGFQDLLVKNRNAPRLRLLRNRGHDAGARSWLVVEVAQPGSANLDAIGARVRVETDRGSLVRSVTAGDGFLVQSSCRMHFGLGHGASVLAIEVRWPDGARSRHEG